MIIQVLHCPYCQGIDIVKHGLSPEGKQRYRCRACLEGRGRTFLLEYTYAGQSPAVKQQIVDMAMNASGIRDTARVLHVSPTTVIKELKKRIAAAAGESGSVKAPPATAGRGGDMACRVVYGNSAENSYHPKTG
jgi:transposase-like protein